MKRALAYFFLLTMMVPALIKVGIVGNYLVQYTHYVTVLCENQDQPELQCNGKCHLAKELKKTNTPAESPELPAVASAEPFFFFENHQTVVPQFSSEETLPFHDFSSELTEGESRSIFQPPRLTA